MSNLYVTVGLPGCGKTTWTQNFIKTHKNVIVICLDNIRKELYGCETYFGNWNEIENQVNILFKKAIEENKYIIYDATNYSAKYRKRVLKKMTCDKYIKTAVFFRYDIDKSLRQNNMRKRHVPEDSIISMAKKASIPQIEEGFDNIIYI